MGILGEKKQEETKFNIDDEIEKQVKAPSSSIVAGIYGVDSTGKTAISFNIRSEEDKKKHRKIILIDFDQGAVPIKKTYWNNDPDIIILNPSVFYESGENIGGKDPIGTIHKTMSILKELKKKDPDTIACVILDGLDIYLKLCEYYMKLADLGVSITASSKALGEASKAGQIRRQDWSIRDQRYNYVIELCKTFPFPVIFITHVKDKLKMIDGELQVVGEKIDWLDSTKNQCFQRIKCTKEEDGKKIIWKATIEKAKGNSELEGMEFIVMEKEKLKKEIKWNGFNWNVFR